MVIALRFTKSKDDTTLPRIEAPPDHEMAVEAGILRVAAIVMVVGTIAGATRRTDKVG